MHVDAVDDAQNNAAHTGHQRGNRPGKRKHPANMNAKRKRGFLVIGHGAHINSLG